MRLPAAKGRNVIANANAMARQFTASAFVLMLLPAAARGYAEAAQALQDAGEADDAYMIGEDPRTGFRVIIGQQRAAARRELNGKAVIWITPDEVAAVLANLEAFKPIAAVKTFFPGAEILYVRRTEEDL